VINERPPQPGRRDGYIEAVARTPIMGFRDDVAVRIRGVGQGARVDVRSASRYGRHDFGTNAARVRVLLDDIDDIANVEKPEKAVRPVQKTNQPANKAISRQAVSAGDRRHAPVATTPRATMSSRWASTDRPAARARRGSSPI